ncbi:ABC transporter, ATP-binding protein [Necator americanus]|uniref:ABC transporter, ATP-binding protein n=1 Tax=Necator americanus TaxID=51031 RepID=W2T9N1_NECAM|nr:ABC transporter, ATP-binding protein [Necator americanus]ETN78578.1 ABC transporter, ATP-binding protein [Necator americanus]
MRKTCLGSAGFSWTRSIAQSLTDAILLLYGGHLVLTDKMSSSVLVTYLLYLDQLYGNIYMCIFIRNTSEHQKKGDEKPEISGSIEMTSINFAYPSRPSNQVLKDLNLEVESGKTIAFVGASGGGKSTIVSLIEQFYKPSNGSIRIDGTPIDNIEHEYYHEKVSLVSQEIVLYDRSIRENILYGCEWATEEEVITAAQMANAHEFITQLADGYETNCGEGGAQLSGGQKQRIGIARALVRKPAVLILDEATSALDAHSEGAIQESLKRISGKLTVLIIAHRLSTIKHADQIYVIDNGTIIQSGTHVELLKEINGQYFSLIEKQRSCTCTTDLK